MDISKLTRKAGIDEGDTEEWEYLEFLSMHFQADIERTDAMEYSMGETNSWDIRDKEFSGRRLFPGNRYRLKH